MDFGNVERSVKYSFNLGRDRLSENTTDAAILFLICDSGADVVVSTPRRVYIFLARES